MKVFRTQKGMDKIGKSTLDDLKPFGVDVVMLDRKPWRIANRTSRKPRLAACISRRRFR